MEASSNSQLTREDPKFCCSAKGSAQGAAAGGGGGAGRGAPLWSACSGSTVVNFGQVIPTPPACIQVSIYGEREASQCRKAVL